eukprot:1647865-Prymnesium_polylepis.1
MPPAMTSAGRACWAVPSLPSPTSSICATAARSGTRCRTLLARASARRRLGPRVMRQPRCRPPRRPIVRSLGGGAH